SGDFDVQRWWPAPLLPHEDGRQISLLFVIAVLSFLAGLSAIGGLAADRASRTWREELIGSATVIVRASGLETADAAAARAAEARFARMSALAGIAGGAAATLAAAALRLFGQGQTLAAILPIHWTDLLAPLPTPFVAAAIAAVTARLTAEAILRRSP